MKYLVFFLITLILGFRLFGNSEYLGTQNFITQQNNTLDSLILKLHIDIPPNVFPKKMVAQITPIVGQVKFDTFGIGGEKAIGNVQTIAKSGGKLNYSSAVRYSGGWDLDAVKIMFEIIIYDGVKELERKIIEVGSGGQPVGYYYDDSDQPIFNISVLGLVIS